METFITDAMAFASRHTIMVVAWVAIFFGTIYIFVQAAFSKVKEVDNAQLSILVNKENGVIIDLRTIDEFHKGHIAGSTQLLPSDIKNKNIGKIELHKDVPVIAVCASGLTSRSAAEQLAKQGFQKVYTLKEGIAGWRSANLPLIKH